MTREHDSASRERFRDRGAETRRSLGVESAQRATADVNAATLERFRDEVEAAGYCRTHFRYSAPCTCDRERRP